MGGERDFLPRSLLGQLGSIDWTRSSEYTGGRKTWFRSGADSGLRPKAPAHSLSRSVGPAKVAAYGNHAPLFEALRLGQVWMPTDEKIENTIKEIRKLSYAKP